MMDELVPGAVEASHEKRISAVDVDGGILAVYADCNLHGL